jgi:hypothetical protein
LASQGLGPINLVDFYNILNEHYVTGGCCRHGECTAFLVAMSFNVGNFVYEPAITDMAVM